MRRYPAALEICAVFGNLLVEGGQVGAGLPVAAVLAFVEDLATLPACLYQQPLGGLVHAGAPVGELGEKSESRLPVPGSALAPTRWMSE
jgi:hypothetical protein